MTLADRSPDLSFDRIDRCTDHQACRDRVTAAGGTSVLVDLANDPGVRP